MKKLLPTHITLSVYDEGMHGHWGFCEGEVEINIDSEDTAWVSPCNRLLITEEILQLLANYLRPMGIYWIRGWGNGGREGRVITTNGLVNCEPWSEVYDAGEEYARPID